jgi:hypothetical protein
VPRVFLSGVRDVLGAIAIAICVYIACRAGVRFLHWLEVRRAPPVSQIADTNPIWMMRHAAAARACSLLGGGSFRAVLAKPAQVNCTRACAEHTATGPMICRKGVSIGFQDLDPRTQSAPHYLECDVRGNDEDEVLGRSAKVPGNGSPVSYCCCYR